MDKLTVYVDGASWGNPGPASIGILLKDELGVVKTEISRSIGYATNNQAEYRALIVALEEAARMGTEHVDILMDSELVVRQVRGVYKTRNEKLKPLLSRVKELLNLFLSYTITHVPREQNASADSLAKKALDI